MKKNYCDYCGKELKGHEGKFIKVNKTFSVDWLHWNCVYHQKTEYDNDELCENCFKEFITLYDTWRKKRR